MALLLTIDAGTASAGVCSKTISACGCEIKAAGVFTVNQNLSFVKGVANCILIVGDNVVLNLNGFSITGPGNGAKGSGVFIKKASTVFVEGQGAASQPAIISGWQFGIDNNGDHVLIQDVDTTGNSSAGIYFTQANSSEVVNFSSSNNSGYGLWLGSGNFNLIGSGTTSSNVLDGVFVGCTGTPGHCTSTGGTANSNAVSDMVSETNGGGGITVQFNSNFNQIGKCSASGNTGGDLVDKHGGTGCAHNLWFANTGTVNKSCVD